MNMQRSKHARQSGLLTIVLVWVVLLTYHYSSVSAKGSDSSNVTVYTMNNPNQDEDPLELDRIVIIVTLGIAMIGVGQYLISHGKYRIR
ncbi:hypothetical protein G7061_09395 [Erysipelothrix sp. HDW6B]|uniref:hypothetical protein n=2 Tax=Erysipelotrichaceae TaxID=128827 RepID=UPI00135C3826|nr:MULTISPECIES: hypothetical protein [Erysipelothrix]QIK86814.1 hypothetical protein G7061_09395 [Erysipelothrix sp. HDW6B]